jgi:hypothetical protein
MRKLCALFALLSVASVAPALAGSSARVAPSDPTKASAEISFSWFAQEWMERALVRGERDRRAPLARMGSSGLVFSYRTVGKEFETELRPTGRRAAPYVGVLRYTERTFTCRDVAGERCRETSSLPMTEVFRHRGGRWAY